MKKILVPYDFSENAMLALDTAVQMAQDKEVSLQLVYVFDFPGFGHDDETEPFGLDTLEMTREFRTEHEDRLREVAEVTDLPNEQISVDVIKGRVWPRLTEFAENQKPDLMILGETGNTYNLGDHFLGTLADKIVHKSPVPVLVVKNPVEMTEISKVVLADDFTNAGELIKRVRTIRGIFSGKVDVVRVNTLQNFVSDVLLNNILADLRNENELQGCSFHSFNHETIANGLIYYSMRAKADMLVVGGKHQSLLRRWFLQEDLAEQIMDFADIPVLILD